MERRFNLDGRFEMGRFDDARGYNGSATAIDIEVFDVDR